MNKSVPQDGLRRTRISRRHFLKQAVAGDWPVPRLATADEILAGAGAQPAPKPAAVPALAGGSRTREYWIQADSMVRNLVPNGRDDLTGATYTPTQTTYQPVGYRAYTPDWSEVLPADADIGLNDGIPGPIIRGQAGDEIVVHFRNNDTRHRMPHSFYAHGLICAEDNDGLWDTSRPDKPGTAVQPGQSYTYRFTVPRNSAGAWLYYDCSMPERYLAKLFRPEPYRAQFLPAMPGDMDMQYKPLAGQLGLFGMVIIADPLALPVDREFVIVLHDLYADDIFTLVQDFDCINGRCFISNTPRLHAKIGDRVRWHVGVLGTEQHVFHIHGRRWLHRGHYTDTLTMAPATTATIEYIEETSGTWLYHCHVTEHMMGGMAGLYIVTT